MAVTHLFREFDVSIGLKRIKWFRPNIPEHPSVLVSKDTATNKACQTQYVRYKDIPEIYMGPSEYLLAINKNYKRSASWSYLADQKPNEKSTQTTMNDPNTRNQTHTFYNIQTAKPNSGSLFSSSSVQLDDYEENPPDVGTSNSHTASMEVTVASPGFSFSDESMKMDRLLGAICKNNS